MDLLASKRVLEVQDVEKRILDEVRGCIQVAILMTIIRGPRSLEAESDAFERKLADTDTSAASTHISNPFTSVLVILWRSQATGFSSGSENVSFGQGSGVYWQGHPGLILRIETPAGSRLTGGLNKGPRDR